MTYIGFFDTAAGRWAVRDGAGRIHDYNAASRDFSARDDGAPPVERFAAARCVALAAARLGLSPDEPSDVPLVVVVPFQDASYRFDPRTGDWTLTMRAGDGRRRKWRRTGTWQWEGDIPLPIPGANADGLLASRASEILMDNRGWDQQPAYREASGRLRDDTLGTYLVELLTASRGTAEQRDPLP